MKTKIAVMLALTGAATMARANIVELPQGTPIYAAPSYLRGLHFFDECRTIPWTDAFGQVHTEKGWASLFGDLNGGTLFDTDLVALDPTPTANLNWTMDDSGFSLRYIVVNDGQDSCKVYRLSLPGSLNIFEGNVDLSAFDGATIQTLDLYGRVPGEGLPDTGATIILLAIALIPLMKRRRQ